MTEKPVITVAPMVLSDGRVDYYVHIQCGDRTITPHMHRIMGRAEYEVEEYRHVLLGTPKPRILDYRDDTDREWDIYVAWCASKKLEPVHRVKWQIMAIERNGPLEYRRTDDAAHR